MFNYFHKNKLRYEKGQLAPFFILILVALITMAMVTVNLSKVASIKTESSNAADAGSLAGGSVMAKTFNAIAQANSQLETYYYEFLASTMVSYTLAFIYLGLTMKLACAPPHAAALAPIAMADKISMGLLIAVSAYWVAANYQYCSIRKMADKGRASAMDVAHQFSFINSGIGQKLNKAQRGDFSDFLKEELEGAQEEHVFLWENVLKEATENNGLKEVRAHSVKSRVRIDEVKNYKLHTTLAPYLVETGLLIAALYKINVATAALAYAVEMAGCCADGAPPCCAAEVAACAVAEAATAWAIGLLASSALGLWPGPSVDSDECGGNALLWIITWIDDVEHDRLVKVDTWQSHQGADLGLWQTRYPDTHSFSHTDFRGRGKIRPKSDDDLRHDASVFRTDELGVED